MAHATHFLTRLDRLSPSQVDAALSLYRDTALLKEVLQTYASTFEGDRIAISLDRQDAGACLIVTREAGVVTCLGTGMVHDLPLVRWAQVDAAIARDRRRRELEAIASGGDVDTTPSKQFFTELLSGGPRVTREQIAAGLAMSPLLGVEFLRTVFGIASDVQWHRDRSRTAPSAQDRNRARRRAWESSWGVGHLTLLAYHSPAAVFDRLDVDGADAPLSPSTLACSMPYLGILARGAWAAAHAGKLALPHFKRILATDKQSAFDTVVGLAAIARAHPKYEAEIRKLLERVEAGLRTLGLAVLDNDHGGGGDLARLGATFVVAHSAHLPEGHRLRFTAPEAVPVPLACALALNYPLPLDGDIAIDALPSTIAWAARAKPEDLYLSQEYADLLVPPWSDGLGLAIARIDDAAAPPREPVIAPKVPGRNEPCSCGSGRKYKKCCGA